MYPISAKTEEMMATATLNFRKRKQYQGRATATPCQRCDEGGPGHYRVQTDLMDMLVCDEWAELARELGLPLTRT